METQFESLDSGTPPLTRRSARLWEMFPRGTSLPEDVWRRRHHFLLGLASLHAVVIALIGPLASYPVEGGLGAFFRDGTTNHTVLEGLIVAAFTLIGCAPIGRTYKATAVGLALMSASAILVHLSGGYIEIHFHFFVMLTFLALYQDWVPYLIAVSYVAVHHGFIGAVWPQEVYNHAAAIQAPWTWAAIHAFFVLWAAAGSVIGWRFNDAAFARTKLILDVAGDGICGLDPDGKIIFANPAAVRMLGVQGQEIVGRPINEVVGHARGDGSDFADGPSPIIRALRHAASCVSSDEIFRRSDGTSLVVDYVSNPIFEAGKLSGAVVAFTDVTHRKRAQEELSERYNELATLHEIGQMIFASTDVEAMFEEILERALRLLSLDLGNLRLLHADGRMPVVAYRGYRKPENIDRYEAKGGAPIIGGFLRRAVASRKSLVIDDITVAEGLQTFKSEAARSAIVVPITTVEESLGVIEVASRAPRKFRPDEVRILEAIGHQVGIALQKARLVQEAERRAREQEALSAIARATSQTLNFDEMLQISLEKVLEVTGREQGYIRLREPGSVHLSLAAYRGISPRYVKSLLDNRRPGGKSERVFLSGEPLVVNETDGGAIREEIRREGSRALVWVPLKVMGAVVGIMNISTTRNAPFEPREVDLLVAIGNVIGVALENARLFREAERRNHELQSLYTVAIAATQSLDTRVLMQVALKTTIEILGVDAGRFYVVDDKRGRLVLAAHDGIPADELPGIQEYAVGEGIIGRIATETRPLAFSDIHSDPNYAASARSRTGKRLGFRSAAGLPITLKGRTVGVIYVYGRNVREFSTRDIELFSAIGGQIGFALENGRLFQELSTKAEELERSNSELQHFAYIASHDLQEPLRMVSSYMQLLSRRYKGKLDAEADEFIAFAVDGAQRMQALINALLSYSRVGTQGKAFEPTDCEKVLDGTLASLKNAIAESGAEIVRSALPTVVADPAQLGQLFQNLVGNALKFRDHRRPAVRIAAERREKDWLFSVADNGVGFDPKYAERVFVMFQRLHSKDEYPGTGIGLAVCKKIVERHGGKIWVESAPGEGSTFYFTIPS